MMWLRQSTAVTIKIGPFVDEGDGKTAETSLTISQADVRLSKNGGDMAQKNSATSCTHDELGYYDCPLSTTDTNTLGQLRVMVHESGALPVWRDFMVLPPDVYDSLVAGSDNLTVDLTSAAVNAVDSIVDAAEAAIRGGTETLESLYVLTENVQQGVNTTTERLRDLTESDGGTWRFTANALEEAPSGGSAPSAADIRAEIDSNSTQLAAILADTDELQQDWTDDGRLDLLLDGISAKTDNLPDDPADQSATEAAITSATSPLATSSALSAVAGNVTSILADTNELQTDWANGGRLDNILDSRAAQTDLTSVLEDTDELQTDWANGGRLDLLLDAKSTQDSVDALELAIAAVQAVADLIQAKTDNLPESPAAVGSQMNLADDAITRSKFDESTAHPLRSADTGASAVARAGSGSPTLETLAGLIANVQEDLDDPDQFKADVSGLATSAALTSVANNVAAILADTGSDGVAIGAATLLLIADAVLKRGAAHTEDTADEGSITELILGAFESSADDATWTIRKTDGTTFNTRDLTLDSNALPVVGVD